MSQGAITVNEGTQTHIATDVVGTVEYGVVKLDMGTIGGTNPFTGTILAVGTLNALASGTITGGTLQNLVSGTVNALASGTLTGGTLQNLVSGTINALANGTISAGTIQVSAGTVNLGTIVGNVASGSADSGNPIKAGFVYNGTAPTGTSGQRLDGQADVNGNLKVTQATLLAGEDLVNNVLKTEQRFSYASGTTAGTTTIKTGIGFIHALTIWGGQLGGIKLTDDTTGTSTSIILPNGTPTATLPCPPVTLDEIFSTGLTIVTGTTTYWNVSYR